MDNPLTLQEAKDQDITFEALSNGFQAKDDAIEKHLYPLLQKDSLDYLSFKHAVENGTISGGLRLAIHKMLTYYAELYARSKFNEGAKDQLTLANEHCMKLHNHVLLEVPKPEFKP